MSNFSRTRDRIQNMAIFFVQHTENVDQLKLDKLFYFTDYTSIVEYVLSISGQKYFADDNGPVPVSLKKDENIYSKFGLHEVIPICFEKKYYGVAEGKTFNDGNFNDDEISILERISSKYRTISGDGMSRESHEFGKPWYVIWEKSRGRGKEIPLEKLVDANRPEEEIEWRKGLRNNIKMAEDAFNKLHSALEK